MDNYIFILTILILLIFFFALFFLIRGNVKTSKYVKWIIVVSIISVCIGVVFYTYSVQKKIEIAEREILDLKAKLASTTINTDSLLLSNQGKKSLLDSLTQVEKELNDAIKKIQSQEKITGKKPILIKEIQEALNQTSNKIDKIESYNEIINNSSYNEIIKNYNLKGFTSSGNTSNFVFYCPQKTEEDYITLVLQFNNDKIVADIAAIYITTYEDKGEYHNHIMGQFYKAQKGLNMFVIKNDLKRKNVKLAIGYFLKSEIEKEYPYYENVTCSGFSN